MWLPPDGGPRAGADDSRTHAGGETSHRFPAFLPQSRPCCSWPRATLRPTARCSAVSLDTKRVSLSRPVTRSTHAMFRRVIWRIWSTGNLVAALLMPPPARHGSAPVTLVGGRRLVLVLRDGHAGLQRGAPYNIRASTLVWAGRDGSVSPLPLPAAVTITRACLLTAAASSCTRNEAGDRNLWIYDTVRDTLSKFTLESVERLAGVECRRHKHYLRVQSRRARSATSVASPSTAAVPSRWCSRVP